MSGISGDAETLKSRGIQVTAQRLAVMRAVAATPHGTAEEIATHVRANLGAISHQGVYDSLAVLVQHGIVRRIEPAGSPARFETRVGDNHHHLVCRACGRTVDVDCSQGAAPCLEPQQSHGFEIDEAEVIFWGVCPSCQKRPSQPVTD